MSTITSMGKAQDSATQATREGSQAASDAAKAERDLATATERVKAVLDPTYTAQKKMNTALQEAKLAFDNGRISSEQYERVQGLLSGSVKQFTVSAGSARAGTAQLGQQIQDIGIQAQMGTSYFTIFAQQTGQLGTAMALMGGKIGAVGAFLSGPWGAAITIATAILGPFIARLFDTGEAAADAGKKAKQAGQDFLELVKLGDRATAAQQQQRRARELAVTVVKPREDEVDRLQARVTDLRGQGGRGAAIQARQAEIELTKAIAARTEAYRALDNAIKKTDEGRKTEIATAAEKKANEEKRKAAPALRAAAKAQRESETAAKKAAREAEASAKRMANELDNLEAKYDKANGGAKAYLTTLEEIDKLLAGGRISDSEAFVLRQKAGSDQRTSDNNRRSKGFDDLLGYKIGGNDDPIKAAGIDAGKILEQIDRKRDYGIDEEAKKAADALKQGAYDVTQILGKGSLGKLLGGLLQDLGLKGNDPSKNLAGSIKKLGDSILGPELSGKIGAQVGKAFQGAADGQFASSIANAVGLKQSKTGAAIGGAIGSALPIPGGAFIGGLIGGTIGGLFKKTKYGAATLGVNADGRAGVTSTGGNSRSGIEAATGAGGSVVSTLDNIIGKLGGTLGQFAVSIGVRKGEYRVDSSGTGKTKGSTVEDFYDDQQGAIMAAVADAIADGAVKGLSPAVTKALRSTKDLDKAVADALGVQNIERLLNGLGGQLNDVFFSLEKEADERLRLAKKYGLDVLAVEKLNAEEREKVIADTLSTRTGALKNLLDTLKFGDLSEGDAFQRRSATLVEIAKAQKDAEAGVEGAADKLADLEQKLVEFSRDAFGTAGAEFGTDRANAISAAERVIQIENDRIKAAADQQKTQTDALTNQNTLTNESNGLIAQGNTTLQNILAALTGAQAGTPAAIALANIYRSPLVAY